MFYKRDMLIKMFSIDVTSSANQFQQQLEQTADLVIKRLEEQIVRLEYLLEEANEKITNLDSKIQIANKILDTTHFVMPDIAIEENKTVRSSTIATIAMTENEIPSLHSTHYKATYTANTDKRSSIIEMADLGYDINEIAKITGISKGEIILLLQLNKK